MCWESLVTLQPMMPIKIPLYNLKKRIHVGPYRGLEKTVGNLTKDKIFKSRIHIATILRIKTPVYLYHTALGSVMSLLTPPHDPSHTPIGTFTSKMQQIMQVLSNMEHRGYIWLNVAYQNARQMNWHCLKIGFSYM